VVHAVFRLLPSSFSGSQVSNILLPHQAINHPSTLECLRIHFLSAQLAPGHALILLQTRWHLSDYHGFHQINIFQHIANLHQIPQDKASFLGLCSLIHLMIGFGLILLSPHTSLSPTQRPSPSLRPRLIKSHDELRSQSRRRSARGITIRQYSRSQVMRFKPRCSFTIPSVYS